MTTIGDDYKVSGHHDARSDLLQMCLHIILHSAVPREGIVDLLHGTQGRKLGAANDRRKRMLRNLQQ